MLDYQFLGMVALILAVVTRGSWLPVLAVTALIGLVSLTYEAAARCYRRRHPLSIDGVDGGSTPPDSDLNRWMAVVERVFGSRD